MRDHQRSVPVEPVADIHHRPGEREGLLGAHESGAGNEERADFHRRVEMGGDVVDNGGDFFGLERIPLDLATDILHARGRFRLPDFDFGAFRETQPPERLHAKPDFTRSENRGIVD